MTTSDELEQWNLRSLENLLGATKNSNKSLKHLGDTLNHTKVDLSRWGGDAAEAWHDMHGHIRTDIDAQGVQSEALFNRLEKLYPDVRSVQTDYNDLKAGLAKNGFAIAPPGTVVTTPSTPAFDAAPLQWITYMQESQTKLDGILAHATAVSAEMADAMYAACGTPEPQHHQPEAPPTPGDPPKPGDGTTTPADQLPLPTKGGQTPFPTEATRDNGPDVSHHLEDNPHPSPLLAGLSADQWKDRLAHFKPGDALPDPRTPTGDKAIDSLANAAGQQNTTYAWGGNQSPTGPTRGVPDGGEADKKGDTRRIGYDCGGLVRYSVEQGAGVDLGRGTDAIDGSAKLGHVDGGAAIPSKSVPGVAVPGDVLVFATPGSGHEAYSGSGTQHTGIYIGNGYMMNAPNSGQPIQIADASTDGRRTDVLRINP